MNTETRTIKGHKFTISGTPQASCTFRIDVSSTEDVHSTSATVSGIIKVKDDLSGITQVGTQVPHRARKFLRRGRLFIEKDGTTYNVMGQKVEVN